MDIQQTMHEHIDILRDLYANANADDDNDYQCNKQQAHVAIDLIGKTVRPAEGNNEWDFDSENLTSGIVVDVWIPDVNHAQVVVTFTDHQRLFFPGELEVFDEQVAA